MTMPGPAVTANEEQAWLSHPVSVNRHTERGFKREQAQVPPQRGGTWQGPGAPVGDPRGKSGLLYTKQLHRAGRYNMFVKVVILN